MEKEPFVRKYVSSDADAVRSICIETANPTFKKNKKVLECVPIIYNDYFTQQEPENICIGQRRRKSSRIYSLQCGLQQIH